MITAPKLLNRVSKSLLLSAIVCALAVGILSICAFGAQPISVGQYDSRLAHLQSDLTAAYSGQSGSSAKALSDAIGIERCKVLEELPAGRLSVVDADNRPIVASIRYIQETGDPTEYQSMIGYVAAIRSSLPIQAIQDAQVDPQRSIVRLLSSQAFASNPIPPESAWDKFWDWVYEVLKKFHLPHVSGVSFPSISPVVPEALLIIILVAAATLLGYIVYQIWRGREIRQARLSSADSTLAIDAEERELVATHNYARLRQLAIEASQSGRYRDAFRLIFLALLVFLDAEGAIKLNRSRTNWEYLRSLRDRDELAAKLRPLVRDFDRIWYGEERAIEADYFQASAVYEDIERSILGVSADQNTADTRARVAVREVR
jgi:hypothetical protein